MAKRSEVPHTMTFKVNKLRSINQAQINLDGITVITGENGSGKSTLSRILYNTIKFSKNYDVLIKKQLDGELREITDTLLNLVHEVSRYEEEQNIKNNRLSRNPRRFSFRVANVENIKDYEKRLYSYINIVKDYAEKLLGTNNALIAQEFGKPIKNNEIPIRTRLRINRIHRILRNVLDENDKSLNFNFIEVLDSLKSKIAIFFEKAYNNLDSRPISLFSNELSSLFHESLVKKFTLIEFGLPITDWNGNRVMNTNWIKNSFYIDTPMAINDYYIGDDYWEELNDELKDDNGYYGTNHFRDIHHIISGEVYYEDDLINEGFKYKRDDGRIFNIEDCATGIKAFGMLQLLLNNGKLTKDTLLIIDEPEAHLHPQWIVEYARIVILLNKQFGVKFFIASHNPDMVSAIKYISEKEGVSERVNFYLAERIQNSYDYNYKALKTEIEEIFTSFNIAIERINQYGISND